MSQREGYTLVQIALHWLTAVLLLASYFLSEGMDDALRARVQAGASGTDGNTLHVWLGGATFLVVLLRLAVRSFTGAPRAPKNTPASLEMAGLWGHRVLYALMLLVPALGALTWYAGVDLGDVHETLATALIIVIGGHVVAAMLHEALLGDGTMARMFRPHR